MHFGMSDNKFSISENPWYFAALYLQNKLFFFGSSISSSFIMSYVCANNSHISLFLYYIFNVRFKWIKAFYALFLLRSIFEYSMSEGICSLWEMLIISFIICFFVFWSWESKAARYLISKEHDYAFSRC